MPTYRFSQMITAEVCVDIDAENLEEATEFLEDFANSLSGEGTETLQIDAPGEFACVNFTGTYSIEEI
jgi:hypothetical protein